MKCSRCNEPSEFADDLIGGLCVECLETDQGKATVLAASILSGERKMGSVTIDNSSKSRAAGDLEATFLTIIPIDAEGLGCYLLDAQRVLDFMAAHCNANAIGEDMLIGALVMLKELGCRGKGNVGRFGKRVTDITP